MSKNILFICKHNRFRSKVAEAFFKKYNKNKNYKPFSGGLLPGRYPLEEMQIKVAKEFGINLKGRPKPIKMDLLMKMSIVVIVANNVPSEIFKNEKYDRQEIIWNIHDDYTGDYNDVRNIIAQIEKKVLELIRELK
jgi:protein-tyrosine-phosphatase